MGTAIPEWLDIIAPDITSCISAGAEALQTTMKTQGEQCAFIEAQGRKERVEKT